MKKKYMFFVLLFIMGLLLIPSMKVNAGLCTQNVYDELSGRAKKITAEWSLYFDESHQAYFKVKLGNIDDDLMIIFNEDFYVPKDGTVEISEYLMGGDVYKFKVYGGYDTDCVEEYLYTKQIKVPKYNYYSEKEECKDNQEWKVCGQFYEGKIENDQDFYDQLNKYINSGEKEKAIKETKKDDFTVLIVIVVVLFLIAVCVFIKTHMKRSQKKVKYEKK